MKRFVSFLSAIVIILTSTALGSLAEGAPLAEAFSQITAPDKTRLIGDVNADGSLNAKDVTVLMKYLVGKSVKDFDAKLADCTCDGKLNAKDVTILMKAIVRGESLGCIFPEDDGTIVQTRDAYMLLENEGLSGEKQGVSSGWVVDNRGGAPKTSIFDSTNSLHDISTENGTAMIREFNRITVGTVYLECAAAVEGAGFSLEFTNDSGKPIYRLFTTKEGWVLDLAKGGSRALLDIKPDGEMFTFRISVDLDSGVSTTVINDVDFASDALLMSGEDANILDFRFATDGPGTPSARFDYVRMYANYAANDSFVHSTTGDVMRAWGEDLDSASGSLCIPKGSHTRRFNNVGGTAIVETQFILPEGENVTFSVGSNGREVLSFRSANGDFYLGDTKIYDGFISNLWYRLRLETDCAGTAKIRLNGRVIYECEIDPVSAGVDSFTVTNHSDGGVLLDCLRVYEKLSHEDYVPRPVRPAGEEKHTVGLNVCSLWRDTTIMGWSTVSPYPENEPVLGYYDEGVPESADWEIKYLVEHGVDFQAFCWYSPVADGPLNTSRLSYKTLSHLHDGFMNAEYSDMMKYCIIWECANGQCPTSEQSFLDNYLPFFIENYFKDDRYMVIDNKPVFMFFGVESFIQKVGGEAVATNIIDDLDEALVNMGYDGALVIASSFTMPDYYRIGVDGCAAYNWREKGASFKSTKDLIYAAEAQSSKLYTIPCASVGLNDIAWSGKRSPMITVDEYRELNEWIAEKYVPNKAKEEWQKNLSFLSTWNEYGEGTYIMPCMDHVGFGYLDVIREVYTDEKADPALNLIPTANQKDRICHMYPQYRHLLRKQGWVDTSDLDAGSVYVNGFRLGAKLPYDGYKAGMELPYETAPTGELLIPFDPFIALDLTLNCFHKWDLDTKTLSLEFSDHTLIFTVGKDTYILDGEERSLGFTLNDLDGLPMLPVERLCADVGYTCEIINGEAHITTSQFDYYSENISNRRQGRWEFNVDGSSEGWTSTKLDLDVYGGSLHANSREDSRAQILWNKSDVNLTASDYAAFEIRCRYNYNVAGQQLMRLYFTTDVDSVEKEDMKIQFLLEEADKGEWITLRMDLTPGADNGKNQVVGWNSGERVRSLRLDPFNCGGEIEIDYIRFLTAGEP